MGFVIENIRLRELMLVVKKNKPFFDEFCSFLLDNKYHSIYDFIYDDNIERKKEILYKYFNHDFKNRLYDGLAREYNLDKSKWFFISWLLRDAPQQRLQPIMSSLTGTIIDKRIHVLMILIEYLKPSFNHHIYWSWSSFSEIMLNRLEGSRRALKGNLFESIVRSELRMLFKTNNINLTIEDKEKRINDETYDVVVRGKKNSILMPVKTRETMGGGHSLLFTRDIFKSTSVAHDNGYQCIPIIIAESWLGNLDELKCINYLYIENNPNQIEIVTDKLKYFLNEIVITFKNLD